MFFNKLTTMSNMFFLYLHYLRELRVDLRSIMENISTLWQQSQPNIRMHSILIFFALFCLCFVFFFQLFFLHYTNWCCNQLLSASSNKEAKQNIQWKMDSNFLATNIELCVVEFKSVFGLSHRPTDLVVYIVRVESYLYRLFITYCRFNLNQTALNSINIQFELLLACTHVALFNVCTTSRRSLIIHI